MIGLIRRFLRFMSKDGEGTGVDGVKTLSAGATLIALEWKLFGLTLAAVAFFKMALGFTPFTIFLILWVGDIALSAFILAAERASGLDITFMGAYRRVIERLISWCWPIGYLVWALGFVWVLLWYGPAYIVAYYKRHLYPRPSTLAIVIVLMAGVQMAAWTPAFIAGVDLIEYLWSIRGG